ncbi:MAG: hypothetical protein AABW47_02610 [Nanoarchaeota archaeon]
MQTLKEKIREMEKIAIVNVGAQIRAKKTEFSETELVYLGIARIILTDAMMGRKLAHKLNQNTINISKILVNSGISGPEAQQQEMYKAIRRLAYLTSNPEAFYKTEGAVELASLLDKMFDSYF